MCVFVCELCEDSECGSEGSKCGSEGSVCVSEESK